MKFQEVVRGAQGVLLACMMSIAVFAAGPSNALKEFQSRKSYRSQSSFLNARAQERAEVSGNALEFVSKRGRTTREVPLGKDASGYVSKPWLTENGAVVIKSTGGKEWEKLSLQFFSLTGESVGAVPSASGMFTVSPVGDLVAIPERHPESSLHYSGLVRLYSSSGALLGEFRTPESGMTAPLTVFSDQGDVGAILYRARSHTRANSGILVFSRRGREIGRYESPDWSPASQDIQNPQGAVLVPLARVDSRNGVVVAEGYAVEGSSSVRRQILAIDDTGRLLWRWHHSVDPRACGSTLLVKPQSQRLGVFDFCGPDARVTELDLRTGAEVRSREFRIPDGRTIAVVVSVAPDEAETLLNLKQEVPGGRVSQSALLLDSSLNLRWRETFAANLGGSARFDKDGSVILRRGARVYVGAFSK
ncbi:MAG: hypothetical protein HY928_15560 [Elusimicrobia bacterium]|nr:hypothetical protein [Elusimicrobiota bacterium]